ncbi:hypothetical protein SESBI_32633 [Sesbania bispinosa]|nr:hypothetical protein SESBI_32633 [Sesbania bispinosa]
MEKIKEKIKAIRFSSSYGALGIEDFCPTVEVFILKDFKVPDFNKYDGSTSPLLHLKTYCSKMAIWSKE